jgi:hypothetical protein
MVGLKIDRMLNLNCRPRNTSFLGFPIIEALYGQKDENHISGSTGNFRGAFHLRILVATMYSKGQMVSDFKK